MNQDSHTLDNFKDFLFATYDIPQKLVENFTMQLGVYTGRINVKIYVPGENEFISFTIRTAIELNNLFFRDKSCHYQLAGTFKNPPAIGPYYTSDKKLFNEVINNQKTTYTSRLLCKAKISEVSLSDFIELTKESFKNIVPTIFCEDFKLKDGNGQTINPILNPNFNRTLIEDYNKSFNTIKNILVPDPDYIIGSFTLNKNEIESLKAITHEVNIVRLRQELADSLIIKETNTKKTKI